MTEKRKTNRVRRDLYTLMKSALRKIKNVLRPRNAASSRHIPPGLEFTNSSKYWEDRYSQGGASGAGSYDHLAHFKASVINDWVVKNSIQSIIEFGCGDGNQLALAAYRNYIGLDISQSAIARCETRFRGDESKRFFWFTPHLFAEQGNDLRAELGLSLDVIFHLVEDDVYQSYLNDLFNSATRHVIIYSSDYDEKPEAPHVRHRRFSRDVSVQFPDWEEVARIPNRFPQDSFAEFVIFAKKVNL